MLFGDPTSFSIASIDDPVATRSFLQE